jgi:CHAT domain-containing protein
MDEPQIPDTEDGRAAAIEDLMGVVFGLENAGRFEDMVELTGVWHHALERAAPDDKLSLAEVALLAAWALHRIGDEHAAERVIWNTVGTANQLVERYQAEAGQDPSDEETANRLERAERAAALALNYWAVLDLAATGEVDRARHSLKRALHLISHSPRNVAFQAVVLHNLGLTEQIAGNLVAARERLREAVGAIEGIPEIAQIYEYPKMLADLAYIEGELGEEDRSERDLRAALALAQARVTGDSPSVAEIEVLLATRLLEWGSPDEAEVRIRQALGIYGRTVGIGNPIATSAQYALAYALWARGHVEDAALVIDYAGVAEDVHLRHRLEMGSDDLRLFRALQARQRLDQCLSMAWAHPDHPEFARTALDAVLRRKSLTTEIFATQRSAQRIDKIAAVRESTHELDMLRERLSEALLRADAEESLAELVAKIHGLEEASGVLHRLQPVHINNDEELLEDPDYKERRLRVEQWMRPSRRLRDVLPGNSALVEFVRFWRLEPRPWQQRKPVSHYLALVWPGSADAPRVVRLGEAEPLDRLIAELRAAMEEDGAALEEGAQIDFEGSRTAMLAEQVRVKVLDPVLIAAGNVTRLLLAPDGGLATLSFGILPTAAGNIADRYEVVYLSSGRDLLRPSVEVAGLREPPLVIADPDYNAGGGSELTITEGFERLPETRTEGTEVAALLGVKPVMDNAATKSRLKAVHSPAVLHVATHGWFLPTTDGAAQREWVKHPRLVHLLNDGVHTWPVRSGLVLAGFNAAWAGIDLPAELGDGLLTAGEATTLDLAGTELVVVSACDTGLGPVLDLEGVFGLRRGFHVAGAHSIVTTLWKVPDEPSRLLILEFYRRLLAGAARATALRDAQRAVRVQFKHPYLWGGFVLHGDPGSLSPTVLHSLRRQSPEVDVGQGDEWEAQRLLAAEAASRGDLDEAMILLHPAGEAGDALSAAQLALLVDGQGDRDQAEQWYERAAQTDNPLAALALGQFRMNRGDPEGAERWWRVAVQGGIGLASQALASSLRRRGEVDEARQIWQAAAAQGDPHSLYAVGCEAHLDGDEEEAARWWARAAEAGEPDGAGALAALAQRRGDDAEFERWWRLAAELGEPQAAMELASAAYNNGQTDEAIALWRGAAERGLGEAAHNLGVALSERGDAGAEAWWRRAVAAGFFTSANSLGNLLMSRKDYDGAAHYWRIAAENGHPKAPVALGQLLLFRGQMEEAERWLRPAAERGDSRGARVLSELLQHRGEVAEAHHWRLAAAESGELQAAHGLAAAEVEREELEDAIRWWEKAARGGEPTAAAELGNLLASTGRDEHAEGWWAIAAEAGHDDAAAALASRRWRRGDWDGVRHAAMAAAAAGGERASIILYLLDADQKLLRERAQRGHVHAMLDLFALAQLHGEENEARRWLYAAADTGHLDSLMAASRIALQLRDHDAAERWLQVAAEGGRPDAARFLAELHYRQGNRDRAARWEQQAERLTEAWAANKAGFAAYEAGAHQDAERHWRAAASAGSMDGAANLAAITLRRGAAAESEQWARVAADRGSAECANLVGMALANRGEHTEARALFSRAVELARGRLDR